MHFRISRTMNAEDIFRCSIGCEIMLMIKARIRLIFSRYIIYLKIKSRISKILCILFVRKISLLVMTHYFANVLYLSICMLGNCSCFYFRLLTFFKIKFLKINHPGPPSECQTVWIQIKTDILLIFIWVQTVCKRL